MDLAKPRALEICAHVLAACGAGHAASAQLVLLTGTIAHACGMARSDAVMLSAMLGFLYLWLILIWVFSRAHVAGAWIFLGLLWAAAAVGNAALGAALATGGSA